MNFFLSQNFILVIKVIFNLNFMKLETAEILFILLYLRYLIYPGLNCTLNKKPIFQMESCP